MKPPSTSSNEQRVILVTGANGYIASQLIPRLLDRGYLVRCLVRDSAHLRDRLWFGQVQVCQGDVTIPETLRSALQGVTTAYYLVHSMASGGNHYAEKDLSAAREFALQAQGAGVDQIIYLGGLANPDTKIARHLLSRIHTGDSLRSGGVPVIEFRAGVIVGPGSISFEMIRFLTEQFPVIICPRWMTNLSQPIAIQNILDYLLAALDRKVVENQIIEIGGSQVMTYAETLLVYARERGLKRRLFLLSFNPVRIFAGFLSFLTPVPASITRPLVEGLKSNSVVRDGLAQTEFPQIQPVNYTDAVRLSLDMLHPRWVEPLWRQNSSKPKAFMHAGFCILHHQFESIHQNQDVIKQEFTRSGRWVLDSGRNEQTDPIFLLQWQGNIPGKVWLEGSLVQDRLSIALLFAPRGFFGFWLWYFGFFRIWFWGLKRKIHNQLG